MNYYSRSSADPPDEDPLSGLLGDAVQQIHQEPQAAEALERALVKARNLQRPFALSRLRVRSRLLIAASLAAMILVGTFVSTWVSPPSNVWAQMLTAVQNKPWIHARTVAPDGTKIDIWVSTNGEITARRYGEVVEYDDYRKGIRYRYDPTTQQVFLTHIDRPSQQSKEKLRALTSARSNASAACGCSSRVKTDTLSRAKKAEPMTKWDRIVGEHGPKVFRIAQQVLGSIDDAEDVMQEVFCEANSRETAIWAGQSLAKESSLPLSSATGRRLRRRSSARCIAILCKSPDQLVTGSRLCN